MASPNKVSPSDCDNDRQPEMAMWPLAAKPEILISLELYDRQNELKFQWNIWGFRFPTALREETVTRYCDNDRQPEMAI